MPGRPSWLHKESSITLSVPSLRSKFRWGIGARLGVAFAAVAGLAVAANLLAEHEISVIRTTRIVPVVVSPPRLPAIASPVATVAPPQKVANPDPLAAAILQYHDAIRARVELHSADSEEKLAAALQGLERANDTFSQQARELPGSGRLRTLRAQITAYRAHGDDLVNHADQRQAVLNEFWERFAALDARMKASFDQAWKIFGRVIARKSLVDLSSSLDDIRSRFERVPVTGDYDESTLRPVIASEAAFVGILEKNALGLSRSLGEGWVAQMRADMDRISALQTSLMQTNAKRRDALDDFSQESLQLAALARAARPARIPAPVPRHAEPDAAVPAASAPLEEFPGNQPIESTENSKISGGHSALIACISGAVLLLLLLVSAWTVSSVVGPVRRMRLATRRLADGDGEARVARGGIQELDELAISFNQMAAQLAAARTVARDYQEQLEAKVQLRTRELQHLADHDPLTQLPNRRQLFVHLKDAIAQAQSNGSCVGVFFLDLDNFKNINDSMGHAFGDRVLEAIAERLRETAGPSGFAARLGGDEFTVVRSLGIDAEEVRSFGLNLVRSFQQPFAVDGRELTISVSVGASIYPDHEKNAEALLRAADAALFRAKALGRSQLAVFSPDLFEIASAKFGTEQGLRRALERGEFELVFQPEVNAATLTTEIVEALLRWRLPDGRVASPAEFLTIAEESGLILEISDWVLRTAIATASRWHHGDWPEPRLAINLSSRQLLDGDFVDHLVELLREHRLPAKCIEIELTENVLQTGAATIEVLHRLRAHGVAIALDDFGTGYSSLASLEKLPLTRVKLDRTLIAGIQSNPRSAAIARAIVGLCHSLDLKVTAEGIESPEQLALLVDQPNMYLQGYLLARPVPADKLLAEMAELPGRMQLLFLESPAAPRASPAPREEIAHAKVQRLKVQRL